MKPTTSLWVVEKRYDGFAVKDMNGKIKYTVEIGDTLVRAIKTLLFYYEREIGMQAPQ
jgi:hypothetical protein